MFRYSKIFILFIVLVGFGCSERRSGGGGGLGLPQNNNNNNNNGSDSVAGDSDGIAGDLDGTAFADFGPATDDGISGNEDVPAVLTDSAEPVDTQVSDDTAVVETDMTVEEDLSFPPDISVEDVGGEDDIGSEEDIAACIPDCFNKVCGDDGCGNSCGECAGDGACNAGQCEFDTGACITILSDCVSNLPISADQACASFIGQDLTCFSAMSSAYAVSGCDELCGNSGFATSAVEAICSSGCGTLKQSLISLGLFSDALCSSCNACVPNCSGKQCGSNGCGGQCGTCSTSQTCEGGKCIAKSNDCEDAVVACAPGLPVEPALACGLIATETKCQAALIKAHQSGGCTKKCATANGAGIGAVQALCSSDCASTKTQMESLGLFVGSWCSACLCTPQCSGKTCGSDGCGGQCGVCGDGMTCNASGQCVGNTTAKCKDVNVPLGICIDGNTTDCDCVGCSNNGMCESDDDCICSDCASDSFCGSAANCINDGFCSPYNEGCICNDCKSHPECAP